MAKSKIVSATGHAHSRHRKNPVQERSDRFHNAIGLCITEWANIDERIFRIFQTCVGPIKQCAIIYYRTPGLDVRVNLTEEIVASRFPSLKPGEHPHRLLKEW